MIPLYEEDTKEKILVFCEDNEAKWFLKKLMDGYNKNFKLPECSIGCNSLVDLINVGEHFKNYIFVFDGDFPWSKKIKKNKNNYILLPTQFRPEQIIRNFIFSDSVQSKKYLSEANKINHQFKIEYFKEHDISDNKNKKEREIYKEWFNKHQKMFEKTKIWKYLKADNTELFEKFVKDFKKIFNKIAEENNIDKI
jgi:hypothetical protein